MTESVQIGDATLYHGRAEDVLPTLAEGCADLVCTDPPYNCGKKYGDDVDDNRPEAEYMEWYANIAAQLYRVQSAGYLYVSMLTPQLWTLRPLWEGAAYVFQQMLLWHGPNYAGNSNTIRGQWRVLYEPILMLLKGKRLPMLNEVRGTDSDAIIRTPRPQSNFAGSQKREHAAQKPVRLYQMLISRTPGDMVIDCFMGSGATGMACAVLGRRYIGIEMNAVSFDLSCRRIEAAQAQLRLDL
jgi:DNA modification methylase